MGGASHCAATSRPAPARLGHGRIVLANRFFGYSRSDLLASLLRVDIGNLLACSTSAASAKGDKQVMLDVRVCAKCGRPLTKGNRLEIFVGVAAVELHKTCADDWIATHVMASRQATLEKPDRMPSSSQGR